MAGRALLSRRTFHSSDPREARFTSLSLLAPPRQPSFAHRTPRSLLSVFSCASFLSLLTIPSGCPGVTCRAFHSAESRITFNPCCPLFASHRISVFPGL